MNNKIFINNPYIKALLRAIKMHDIKYNARYYYNRFQDFYINSYYVFPHVLPYAIISDYIKEKDFKMVKKNYIDLIAPILYTDIDKEYDISNNLCFAKFKEYCYYGVLVQTMIIHNVFPDTPNESERFQKFLDQLMR